MGASVDTERQQARVNSIFPDGELDDAAELGAVDSQGVRVWVRRSGVTELSARLEVEGQAPVTASARLSAETDWTGVLTPSLPRPAPGSAFACVVGARRLTGRLAAAPETHTGLVFGFGSCHQPFAVRADGRLGLHSAAGLYPVAVGELQRAGAQFMLLVGDQIYSDDLAPVSVGRQLAGATQALPPLEEAIAAYRRVTRGYFGHAGFRALREAFPTYCMWDDHDIFNNWGSRLRETALDRRLFAAAARVYCEYQHLRNPGGVISVPPYHYTFRHGDVGFLVLDVRGARDYQSGQMLGAAQWDAIRAYLRGEDARTLQTLFVVTSVPIAHAARWFVKLFEGLPTKMAHSVRDRWCARAFVHSRDALLAELFTWQTLAPGRQVILLSGDIHAASAFTIRRRGGRGVVQQFTSSALSTPQGPLQVVLNSVAVHALDLYEPQLRFRRHFLAFANNFGLVHVDPLAQGGHRVRFTVRAWQPRTQRLATAGRVVSMPEGA